MITSDQMKAREAEGELHRGVVKSLQTRIAELEVSLAAADKQVDNMSTVMREARHKLQLYRDEHSGVYVGGVEFTELMKRIDAVLPPQ